MGFIAWLTIDGFRWYNYIPDIPEDLNYGLVLNYPNIICEYSAFMAGLNRAQILSKMPKSILKQCEKLAWDGVRRTLERVNSRPF